VVELGFGLASSNAHVHARVIGARLGKCAWRSQSKPCQQGGANFEFVVFHLEVPGLGYEWLG
jgi:hypothetical protein